jgi:hypothetical protein
LTLLILLSFFLTDLVACGKDAQSNSHKNTSYARLSARGGPAPRLNTPHLILEKDYIKPQVTYASLQTDQGKEIVLRQSALSDERTGMSGTITFAPVPKSAKSIRFSISQVQLTTPIDGIVTVPGKWDIEISLP